MTRLTTLVASLCFLSILAAVPASSGEATSTLFVLTADASPKLVTVPLPSAAAVAASRPLTISTGIAITNVAAGETLVGIDVRPQTQRLYALGVNATANTATLYHLAPETGFAAVVGTAGSIAFTTDGTTPVDFPDPATVPWDIDFNPSVDRIRVVAGGLSFRLSPSTGVAVDGDNGGAAGSVAGANPDGPINGGTTTVSGVAYTNNQPNNGSVTTLYTLDAATNSLFVQNPPNTGTQTIGQAVTLGGNPLDFSTIGGFDIPPGVNTAASNAAVTTGSGFAILNVGGVGGLYTINLVTAQVQKLGDLSSARSMAIRTELGAVVAMDATGSSLLRFSPSTPGTVTTQAMNLANLRVTETLVGIDFRPQTGQFYGLAIDATGNNATLYLVDPQTGSLTAVGTQGQIAFVNAAVPVDLPTAAAGWGVDFNPTADRLRVTTATGLNFRVNPNTGAPVDGDLGGAAGSVAGVNTDGNINGSGSTGVSGVAYTRSFAQTLTGGTTTLFTLDSVQSQIFIQFPVNAGTQTAGVPLTLGRNPLSIGVLNGFDIPASIAASPEAWVGATSGATTSLFRVKLTSGAATNVGAIGAGAVPLSGLTVFTTAVMVVEAPVNEVLYNNVDNVDFGITTFGTPVTKTVTLRNPGSQLLSYSAATSAPVTITQNASGAVEPGGTVTIELTLDATTVTTMANTLTITNSDAAVPTFTVGLSGAVTAVPPTVTTQTSADVTTTGATLGGNTVSDGGAAITESGVVYALTSANANPLINGTGVTKVAGASTTTGVFTVPVTGLAPHSAYSFKAYATNSAGDGYTSVDTFTTANTAPVISSNPNATPNPASTGQTVTLNVAATDADSDTLTYSWSVGGDTLTGQSPTTTFAAAGTYTATVTITDGFGGSASGSVDITIVAPLFGTGPDTDGDSFSDSYETAAGTNPASSASSPTGGATPTIEDLIQSKLAIALNFAKPASDSVAFAGTLPIPAGFRVEGKTVTVDVGGVIKGLTLDAKGKAPKGNYAFSLAVKSKKGVVEAQTAKFSVKFSKGDFDAFFTDEGLTNADAKNAPANIVVRVIAGDTVYQHTQAVLYSAKTGKAGSAKAVK